MADEPLGDSDQNAAAKRPAAEREQVTTIQAHGTRELCPQVKYLIWGETLNDFSGSTPEYISSPFVYVGNERQNDTMNPIQVLACLTAVTGLVIFGLAIPLILRRIPPNGIYGVRTRASFASESDWYRINSIGGRHLAVSGLIIFIFGVVGLFLPISMYGGYSITAAVVTLLAVFLPCLRLCMLKPSKSSTDKTRA